MVYKKIISVCIVLLVIIVNINGQKRELVLKNKYSGEEKIFHDGKRLRIVLINGKSISGKLELNDSLNFVNNDNFRIINNSIFYKKEIINVNICEINRILTGDVIRVFGHFTIGLGCTISAEGSLYWAFGGYFAMSGTTSQQQSNITGGQQAFIAGLICIGAGILINQLGQKYRIDSWEISLRTE